MSTRATFQKKYLRKYTLIAVASLLWAAYCAYDAFYAYPKKLKYAEAFAKITGDDDEDRRKQWKAITDEKGWPYNANHFPKKPEKIRHNIHFSYLVGAAGLLVGIPALFLLITNRNAWIEGSDTSLTTSWGQSFDYKDVTEINKRRWDKKGIAILKYDDNGTSRIFVLDDFKFERMPVDTILRNIEACLKPEQIVGGISEAERDKQKSASKTSDTDSPSDSDSASSES